MKPIKFKKIEGLQKASNPIGNKTDKALKTALPEKKRSRTNPLS